MESKNPESENTNTDDSAVKRYSPHVRSPVTAIRFFAKDLPKLWSFFLNTSINRVHLTYKITSNTGGPALVVGIDNDTVTVPEGSWLVKDDLGRVDSLSDEEFRARYAV